MDFSTLSIVQIKKPSFFNKGFLKAVGEGLEPSRGS